MGIQMIFKITYWYIKKLIWLDLNLQKFQNVNHAAIRVKLEKRDISLYTEINQNIKLIKKDTRFVINEICVITNLFVVRVWLLPYS